jgi:hypothetical protein
MPDEYNDADLQARIQQLEDELDSLKEDQSDTDETIQTNAWLIYGAMALGILGVLLAIFFIMSKTRRKVPEPVEEMSDSYYCMKCGRPHRIESTLGKEHDEFKRKDE